MSRENVLARGRQAAEASFVDTCTIRRRTGTTTDPDTGQTTPTYSNLYSGTCRVQQKQAQANQADVGEAYLLMLMFEVQLPMSVTGLRTEDEITITASAHDPDLPNRVFLIRELAHKTDATARRVGVQERTS